MSVWLFVGKQYYRLHLRSSGESTYTLIKNHHISSSTIDKLRHNKPLNTTTINDLCRILSCKVEDILLYIPSDDDQIL
ncbi:MAG TPA: XRE family transcriptional regulator [Ruminococcaceae bacterium]|nr:XRE family transcriptional regulator [Oscillospiraceae bacterium]